MRLPGPLCVTKALPNDPGTLNLGHSISPMERHEHSVQGRAPTQHRHQTPEPTKSILEISAGKPFKTYPETLSVSPDLIKLLQDLQRDNKVGTDVIERAAIVTRTGVLYALSKEQHIKILGGRVQNAWETSPRAVEVHKGIVAEQRDPSALQAEIAVHTHPGLSAPSPEDITNASLHPKSALTASKSLVVGAKRMFLMIPTSETWSKKSADVQDTVRSTFYGSQQPKSVRDINEADQGNVEGGIATAGAIQMQMYEFVAPGSFRRLSSVHKSFR